MENRENKGATENRENSDARENMDIIQNTETAENIGNSSPREKTLLIIDDTSYNIELLTDVFRGSYRILSAGNGKDGLDIMRSNVGEIDVVLLDIVMPEMDGYQVLLEMSMDEKLKYIPVVVITASDDPESEHQAFDYGAFDFITRPFNLKTLKYRVNSVFHKIELDRTLYENEQLKKAAETERHLSALMDNLPGGVAIISTEGVKAECTYFNSPVPKLLCMEDKEFTEGFGKDPKEYDPWLRRFIDLAKIESKFDFAFCVGGSGEHEVWVRMIASALGENDGKKSLYCVFLDITAEKLQERRAEEANQQLRTNKVDVVKLINSAPGGIALSEKGDDGRMHVLYSSSGLADIFGYPDYETYLKDTEYGARNMVSNVEADGFRSRMSSSLMTGMPIEYTFNCKDYSGKPIWIMVRAQFLKSEAGRLRLYCFITNVTKEKTYEIELKNNAYYDSLTGLFNRGAFFLNAKELLSDRPDKEYVIYRVNIGSFKLINDIMGREVGDKMLTTIALTLRRLMPDDSVLARFFADNFAMLLPGGTVSPEQVIDRIKESVADTGIVNHDVQYYVGVYTIKDRDIAVEDMCDRASIACRSISGRFSKHVAHYDTRMRDAMLEEQEIRDETRSAIAGGQFCVYYQPVYSIKSKKFVSAEALVRWKHPTKGLISPGKFIPTFERNGFIAELDLYVLEQVCKYQKKRRDLGLEPFPISVNISRMSLYNPKLFDIVSELTDKYSIEHKYFRIEITETAYNDNPSQLLGTVNKLREKCYPVLMDDFGSGYSSLNTLKDIPIDLLKLDMKFMQGFESNTRVGTIVTAVARMAKWLNVPMLAEGVETKEQFTFLESIGCAYIQGYYFAKPIPEEEFTKLIQDGTVTVSDTVLENYGMGTDIHEILGGNATLNKLIGGVFGGLGIYELSDDKLEVIRVNEGYMQIMGYSPEEFTGEHYNIWEKVYPDDIGKSKNACLEAARTDTAVRAVIRRYNRDGKLMHLDGIHRRLGGSDECPIFCIAFNDITDQLEQEKLIEQSRYQIESILDATGAVVVDVDYVREQTFCKGDIDDFDITEEELSRDLISNKSFESIAHPDDVKRLEEWHKIKSEQRITEEFRLKKKDGQYHWCRISEMHVLDKNGNMTRKIGFLSDISEEKRISDRLKETQLLMDSTMKNISAGVVMAKIYLEENRSEILYSNDSVWRLAGMERDDSIDLFRALWDKVHPDDRANFDKILHSLSDKKTKQSINIRVCKDDEETWSWINLSATNIDGSDRICVVISDITDLKMVTSQLETLVDNAPCGIAMFEKKNNYDMIPLFVGKNYYSITGMRKSRHFDFYQSVHPDDVIRLQDEIQKGGTIHAEYRVIKEEGEAWLELTAAPTGAASDSKQLYMVILMDVTEKRKATKQLEAIIDNLEGGIGLINDCGGKLTLNYSNDKFLSVLNIANTSKARFSKVLSEVVDNPQGNSDIILSMPDRGDRTIRIHLAEFEDTTQKGTSYIAAVDDVTVKRAQGKSRIEERKANAANGNYDEVFEIDYNEKTTRMISSRRHPEKVKAAKVINLENVLLFWVDKYLHPDDRKKATDMFTEPMRNADFTDAYIEVRMLDPEDKGAYKKFGVVLVRSEGDFCMLFFKNIEGKEQLPSIEEVRELDRLYKQVALQTNTTVVEFNHLTDTVTCSPSIKNYAAGYLSNREFKEKEIYSTGLVIHPDDREEYGKFLQNMTNTDSISSVVLRMKMADGGYKWCRLSASFDKKPNGVIVKSLCTINEVDNEIRALQQLDEKSKMLNRTVSNVPTGIGIFKIVGDKVLTEFVSEKTYEIFGLSKGEKADLSLYVSVMKKMNLNVGATEDNIYRAARKDGSSFWLNIRHIVRQEGEKLYIYASLSDVSEKVEHRRKEEVQEQLYQLLLEESGTVIFDYDLDNDRLFYYQHLFGEETTAITVEKLSQNPDSLTLFDKTNSEEFVKALERLSQKEDTEELPLIIYADGYPRHFRGFFKSMTDSSGKVFRIIGKIEDVDDEVTRINEIRAKAMYDPLCVEIYNRATTEELIRTELQRSSGGALLMLDVDDFKSINDRLGHMFGDEFLRQFASAVKSVFRETDIVGRYGGDEFFVFLNHASSALAIRKGKDILERVAEIQVPEIGTVKSSIGISMVNPETRSYAQLMKQADSALYAAKNRGKNQVVLFDSASMNESIFRTALPSADRKAVPLSSNPSTSASMIMRVFSALHSSGDIKLGIERMLAFVGKHFDVSRAYIFEDSDDGLYCSNTFEWCNEGVEPEKDTLQNISYEADLGGTYKSKFNEDGIFYCLDITELIDAQREILERQGIKSILQCVISEDGKFKGFVGFDECRDNRFWTKEQVDALAYVSKILGSFLLYERSKTYYQHYSRSLETILMQYPEYIYIIEPETYKLLYVNKMVEDVIGSDKAGLCCHEALCGDKDFKDCPIKELIKSGKSTPVEMFSPVLNKRVKTQAAVVEWNGRKAYMVSCLEQGE